jgi:hypothetical protein
MDDIQEERVFPEDCMPPEALYSSRDEVYASINRWAASRGYAFVIGRSSKSKSGRKSVTFNCDRGAGRMVLPSQDRRRATSSRRVGCNFSILATESLCKTIWSLKHRVGDQYNTHNHEPSISKLVHPAHRQISAADRAVIHGMANAGIAPKLIRSFLRQNTQSEMLATPSDIDNCISQGRRDLAEGQSSIHALANALDKQGFWNRMQMNEDNRVTAIFFAHPRSMGYLKSYPDLLIIDCTYKTNKYKMPLLDIIGVDALQRSFCVAFAFLSGEEETDYDWALSRLRDLYKICGARLPSVILTDRCLACMSAIQTWFPEAESLLCVWHANKAVIRYCLAGFTQFSGGHDTNLNQA